MRTRPADAAGRGRIEVIAPDGERADELTGTAIPEDLMRGRQIVAIVLIVAGLLVLVYGGFSYTKDSHKANLGPIDITMKERERVHLPTWLGIALVIVGAGVLLVPVRKS